MAKPLPVGPALLQKTSARPAKARACSYGLTNGRICVLKPQTTYIPTGFGRGKESRVQYLPHARRGAASRIGQSARIKGYCHFVPAFPADLQ
jgi:hypothetical protein